MRSPVYVYAAQTPPPSPPKLPRRCWKEGDSLRIMQAIVFAVATFFVVTVLWQLLGTFFMEVPGYGLMKTTFVLNFAFLALVAITAWTAYSACAAFIRVLLPAPTATTTE